MRAVLASKLFRCRARQIAAAIARRALKAPVLVKDDAGRRQQAPRQMVGEAHAAAAIFSEVQHVKTRGWRTWRRVTSRNFGSRFAAKTATP